MLTDSLVTLVTECFRHNNVTAPQAARPPLSLGFGLLRAGDCRRWTDDGLALLTQEGAAWHLLYYVVAALLLFIVYRVAFLPVDMVKDLTEVGWGYLGGGRGSSLTERIREVQRLRKKGNLPPVYPNGWFAVIESHNLAVGQVKSVQVLGQTLAVFRGSDGQAHVTDAYCPHIGANMAVGGVVKGNCLECPFHGWRFRGTDGKCVEIPYTAKDIPRTANVRRWESRELMGSVFVWHDAEGRDPLWELPEVPQVANGSWKRRGRTEHQILAHIQDIHENGADMAHFGHIHVPIIFKGSDLRDVFANNTLLDFAKHSWSGEWQARGPPESHVADLSITHNFSLFGGRLKLFTVTAKVEQALPPCCCGLRDASEDSAVDRAAQHKVAA